MEQTINEIQVREHLFLNLINYIPLTTQQHFFLFNSKTKVNVSIQFKIFDFEITLIDGCVITFVTKIDRSYINKWSHEETQRNIKLIKQVHKSKLEPNHFLEYTFTLYVAA